jgi:hypothetical protein
MPKPLQVTVKIEGLNKLVKELSEAGANPADLRKAGKQAASIVLVAARPMTPTRTGRLAASLRVSAARSRAGVWGGSNAVPYADVIHWGWPDRHIRQTEWLSRAAVLTQSRWLPGYVKAIDEATAKVKGYTGGGSS